MEKEDLYLELLRGLDQKIDVLDKKQTEHTSFSKDIQHRLEMNTQRIEFEIMEIKKLDEKQNMLLEDHMRRTSALERDVDVRERAIRLDLKTTADSMSTRIEQLEQPKKWLQITYKIILVLGGAAAALVSGFKLYEYATRQQLNTQKIEQTSERLDKIQQHIEGQK